MLLLVTRCLVLVLAVGDLVISANNNSLLEEAHELMTTPATPTGGARRALNSSTLELTKKKKKKTKERSTSSDSKDPKDKFNEEYSGEEDNLQLTDDTDDESESLKKEINKYMPKSSNERKGWKKWHRKCTPCIGEEKTKWRNPSIKWICGAYQTARRSFKSPCIMRLRNCQDGTMFIKIHDHRCHDDPAHGKHFFYDYKVRLNDESESGTTSESESDDETDASYSSTETRRAIRRRRVGGLDVGLVLNGTASIGAKVTVSNGTVAVGTAANSRQNSNTTARQTYIKRNNTDQPNL